MIRIGGYAAVWNRVDRAGDVMRPNCFQLAFAGAEAVPLLWQHRGVPVGEITRVAEDARGLRVEACVTDAEAARLVRAGALPGLSVGYRPRLVQQGAWREIRRAELIEVSLVAVPMQPAARVEVVAD